MRKIMGMHESYLEVISVETGMKLYINSDKIIAVEPVPETSTIVILLSPSTRTGFHVQGTPEEFFAVMEMNFISGPTSVPF